MQITWNCEPCFDSLSLIYTVHFRLQPVGASLVAGRLLFAGLLLLPERPLGRRLAVLDRIFLFQRIFFHCLQVDCKTNFLPGIEQHLFNFDVELGHFPESWLDATVRCRSAGVDEVERAFTLVGRVE